MDQTAGKASSQYGGGSSGGGGWGGGEGLVGGVGELCVSIRAILDVHRTKDRVEGEGEGEDGGGS